MADAKSLGQKISGLDMPAKLVLFGSAAAALGCLLKWFGVDTEAPEGLAALNLDVSVSGLDCTQGRIAVLGALAAAGTLLHDLLSPVDAARAALYRKVQLGGAGLALACVLYFWLRTDTADTPMVSTGFGLGLFVSLLGSGAATFGAWQRFRPAAPAA